MTVAPRHRARRLVLLPLVSGLLAAPAAGQIVGSDACRSAATDGLAAARRARSAVADRAAYTLRIEERVRALRALDAEYGIEDGALVQFSFADQSNAVEGYRLCGAEGGPAAELTGGWTGIGFEWRTLDDAWRVAASLVAGGDSLSPSAFVADDETLTSPDAVGQGYVFWLIEARLTEWFTVGYGQIHDAEARFSLGEDASGATASNSEYITTDAPGRHFLGFGVPRWGIGAGLIVGQGLDFGELTLGPLPVPGAAGLELGGRVARLADEDIEVTGLTAAWPLLDGRIRPAIELAMAWPDARLRTARLRVDGGIGGSGRVPGGDLDTTLGWGHLGLDAFFEASRFSSAALIGDDTALGYAIGITGRAGLRAGDLEISAFAARDRVETLTRLPDAGGRTEVGLGVLLRIGW